MPLESLRQPFDPEQAGHKLREVQVEHEPEREGTAKQQYEKLLESPLYDRESEAWYEGERLTQQRAQDQLFGVMAIAEFDKRAAQKKFKELENSPFCNSGSWHTVVDGEPLNVVNSFAVITSIAAEAYFNPERGRKLYENFVKEGIDKGQSHLLPKKFPLGPADLITTQYELEHVYIQSFFDPQAAKHRYQELKQSPLWNESKGMWCWNFSIVDDVSEGEYILGDQLLNLLIEMQLGIPGAAEKYEKMKRSQLFDTQEQLWNYSEIYETGSSRIESWKYTEPQLLSVIVESRLEKMRGQTIATPTKLPEERNF